MGNKVFYGVIVFIIVAFAGIFIYMSQAEESSKNEALKSSPYTDIEDSELSQPTIDTLTDENYSYNVTYDEHKEMIEEGEVYVYYWSPTCPYCTQETPKIVDSFENGDNEDKKFVQVNVYEYDKAWGDEVVALKGTPMLVKYNKGERVSELVGAQQDTMVYDAFFNDELDGYIQSRDGNQGESTEE